MDCPKPKTKADVQYYGGIELTYIYCLYKKGESMPFYVGITKNPKTRLRAHEKEKGFDKAIFIKTENRQSASMIEEAIIALIPSLDNATKSFFDSDEYKI